MRILLVLEYYHPHIGGLEKLFKTLSDKLAAEGHHILILTNRHDRSLPARETDGNVSIYRYAFGNRYLFTFLAWIPAIRLARSVDLVQTTSYNAGLPAFIAARIARKKVCITFHEVWQELWCKLPYFGQISRWTHYAFEWFLLRLPFHRFIAVSEHTRMRLLQAGVAGHRVIRIYNGIDYERFQRMQKQNISTASETFRFLYFGRLGISKGIDVLLRALDTLSKDHLSFKLSLIISREPTHLYRKVTDYIHTNELESCIELHHDLPEEILFREVQTADAVIIPSYSEGFCYAAAEAVALDKPIISSGQGALPEVVGGKYLSYNHPDAHDLAEKMNMAMQGEWQMRAKTKFPLQDTIRQYITLYKNLVSSS